MLRQKLVKILELCSEYKQANAAEREAISAQIRLLAEGIAKQLEQQEPGTLKPLTKREKAEIRRMLGFSHSFRFRSLEPQKQQGQRAGGLIKAANFLIGWLTLRIGRKGIFKKVAEDVKQSSMQILPFSYISLMLFFILLILAVSTALSFAFSIGLLVPILLLMLSFAGFCIYPKFLLSERKKAIDQEVYSIILQFAALREEKPINIIKAAAKAYPQIRPEMKRAINSVEVFGFELSKALEQAASNCPSPRFKMFLFSLSANLGAEKKEDDSARNLASFLKKEAELALNEYAIKDIEEDMPAPSISFPRFRKQYFFWMALAVTIIAFDIYYFLDLYHPFQTGIVFYLLLLAGALVGWAGYMIDFVRGYNHSQAMEKDFVRFVNLIKETKGGVKEGDAINFILKACLFEYTALKPHIIKLSNQLKMGIPLKRALHTFAKDTQHPLIMGVISSALESKSPIKAMKLLLEARRCLGA